MASAETLRTFGEKLRTARIEQNRSLDEIAAAIKINRRHLESIESGDLSQLPQGPYVAAFVREYARALGIPVPPEYAPLHAPAVGSPRDPKVVSHPAHQGDEGSLTQIARDTARLANTAVKGAVKTVTKTTESVVNMVETGSKEALEVLTSRELWEEAENIRRERHGLPPLERPREVPPAKKIEEPKLAEPTQNSSQRIQEPIRFSGTAAPPARISRRTTNIVIVVLAIIFGGVVYLSIRMSRTQGHDASIPNRDYVPAPVETPSAPVKRKPQPAPAATTPVVTPIGPTDSLQFQLRATQPVWVSIAPDGIPAYRGQMNAGEIRSFRAAQKFVVDIGNQKSVAMTFDGAPLSGLPAIQNSSVVVRNLVLMRDHVLLGGNTVDLHKLTTPPAVPSKPAAPASNPPAGKVSPGVPPPPIAKHMEDLARKARMEAAQKAKAHNTTSHTKVSQSTQNSRHTKKQPQIPQQPIHPVQPIPPRP